MKKILVFGALTLAIGAGIIVSLGGPEKTLDKVTGKESSKDTEKIDNSQPKLTELQKELASTPVLEPVAPEAFGDFKIIATPASQLIAQNPTSPSKVDPRLDTSKFQGVLYKVSDASFRVLYGKLSDESKGVLKLESTFELISDGGTQVSLRKVDPTVTQLETVKIVRWTNLPTDHQVVKAMEEYKKQNP